MRASTRHALRPEMVMQRMILSPSARLEDARSGIIKGGGLQILSPGREVRQGLRIFDASFGEGRCSGTCKTVLKKIQ